MKKVNLTIIATVIATFVVSMFAFQPTATEAGNNATPSATPRRIRGIPAPTPSPITRSKTKTATTNLGDTATHERRKRNNKAIRKNNKFFDAPKLDADSGLEAVGNRNTNQQRMTSKPKGKRNSAKRVQKP